MGPNVGKAVMLAALVCITHAMSVRAQPPTASQPSGAEVQERASEVRRSHAYPVDLVLRNDPSSDPSQLELRDGHARKRVRKNLDRGIDPQAQNAPQFGNCAGLPGLGPGFGYACLAVCGVLLILAIVLAVVSWLKNRGVFEPSGAGAAAAGAPLEFVDPLLATKIEDHVALAQEGRFREAIRALFLLVLSRLVDLGSSHVRGSTAREIVTELRAHSLTQLLQLTEVVWFGGREAGFDDYQRALTWATEAQSPGSAS